MPTTLQLARPELLHPCHNLLHSLSNITNEICDASDEYNYGQRQELNLIKTMAYCICVGLCNINIIVISHSQGWLVQLVATRAAGRVRERST